VSDQDQLQWEARFGRLAGVFAFAAALLLLGGTFALQSIFKNRAGIEPLPDFLLSVDKHPSTLIISNTLLALSALCLIPVFYFLFRAIVQRAPQVPKWFVYLIFVGPVFYAVSQIIGGIDRVDVAHKFAQGMSHVGKHCPAIRGKAGDDCANDLLRKDVNPIVVGLSLGGSVATAFLFVMLPLRARRVGLMSQFMAILGVIAGALMVLKLMPLVPEILQAFWLGAVGALFIGNWPGGRGPAWQTGQPDPWPSAAERRGMVPAGAPPEEGAPGGGRGGEPSGASTGEPSQNGDPGAPEPAPQRPSSRKRRRKRR
jgi:hypothetical protein